MLDDNQGAIAVMALRAKDGITLDFAQAMEEWRRYDIGAKWATHMRYKALHGDPYESDEETKDLRQK